MRTSTDVFAKAGNPWSTPEDWAREERAAQVRDANLQPGRPCSAEVQSAREFTRVPSRAALKRAAKKSQNHVIFRDPPRTAPEISEHDRMVLDLRQSLKAAGLVKTTGRTVKAPRPVPIAGLRVKAPAISEFTAAELAARTAEPKRWDPPKPLTDSEKNQRERRAHWLKLREHWAKDLNHSDPLRIERALVRLDAIDRELAKLA